MSARLVDQRFTAAVITAITHAGTADFAEKLLALYDLLTSLIFMSEVSNFTHCTDPYPCIQWDQLRQMILPIHVAHVDAQNNYWWLHLQILLLEVLGFVEHSVLWQHYSTTMQYSMPIASELTGVVLSNSITMLAIVSGSSMMKLHCRN